MKFNRKILANGLRVLTIPMPSFESATVMVMVGAGSRYETKLNNGISHFLEHMAFKGTAKRPSAMDIAGLIDEMGGEFNASTGKEVTAYYIKAGAKKAELCLDVLSDMLKNSKLDSAEIEKEKGVIIEEINMNEDSPLRDIGDVYERLVFGDNPMGWNIAGEKDIVRKITREDFITYTKSLYSPHNMTVVFAGGIDEKTSVALAQKYLGDMQRVDTLTFNKCQEEQEKPRLFLKTKKTEQATIALGFRTVAIEHPDKYPLEVLAAILGGGMSSRLFHEVREKRGLGYFVSSSADSYQDVGSFSTMAGIDPKRIEEAIKVILEEHHKISNFTHSASSGQISNSELKKAKEYMKGHLVLGLENSRSVAYFYASQELLEKEINNPNQVMEKIDAVSLSQVEAVAKKYFVEKGLNMAIIGNFEDGQKFENLLHL